MLQKIFFLPRKNLRCHQMYTHESELWGKGSVCPNPKPGCGMVGAITLLPNALKAPLQTAVFHVQVNMGPRSTERQSHSVPNLSPDLAWAAETPPPSSRWSSPAIWAAGRAPCGAGAGEAAWARRFARRGAASAGAATDVPSEHGISVFFCMGRCVANAH